MFLKFTYRLYVQLQHQFDKTSW